MLNSVGLANPGLDRVRSDELPWLASRLTRARVIVNVVGFTVEEYGEVVSGLDEAPGITALELNLSCPNTSAGGVEFGSYQTALTAEVWDRLRAKWTHAHGLTNVWQEPPVHNGERVRVPGSGSRYLHANQKPLSLMERQILASTSPNDVVWEPFGGLCSATVAAVKLGRVAYTAEVNRQFFDAAVDRVRLAKPERIRRIG